MHAIQSMVTMVRRNVHFSLGTVLDIQVGGTAVAKHGQNRFSTTVQERHYKPCGIQYCQVMRSNLIGLPNSVTG